jgi:hypothetical protein
VIDKNRLSRISIFSQDIHPNEHPPRNPAAIKNPAIEKQERKKAEVHPLSLGELFKTVFSVPLW